MIELEKIIFWYEFKDIEINTNFYFENQYYWIKIDINLYLVNNLGK